MEELIFSIASRIMHENAAHVVSIDLFKSFTALTYLLQAL